MKKARSSDDTSSRKWAQKLKDVVIRNKGGDYSGILDLGVVYTGYLEKRHPSNVFDFNQRYVVLTHKAIHWFKRFEEDIFFGEERGSIILSDIIDVHNIDVRVGDKWYYQFEIVAKTKKVFRASNKDERDKWIAVISFTKENSKLQNNHQNSNETNSNSVVLFVTVGEKGYDTMMKKGVSFGESIELSNVKRNDIICITLSNGASASISRETLKKYNNKKSFGVDVIGFPLCSELILQVKQSNQNWRQKFYQLLKRCISHKFQKFSIFIIIFIGVGISSVLYSRFPEWREALIGWLIGLLFVIQALFQSFRTDSWDHEQWVLKVIEHKLVKQETRSQQQKIELPKRYLHVCKGDEVEAMRRYKISLAWRAEENIDNILNEKIHHFDAIKKFYPHYFCGRSRKGNQVYYEQLAQADLASLKSLGLSINDLAHYYIYMLEYLWTKLEPRETGKLVSVIDLIGVKPSDLAGEGFEYIRKTASLDEQHYPERCEALVFINIPFWFQAIWKLIRPLLDEHTQQKVRIYRSHEVKKGLEELIDINNIPEVYGGNLRFVSAPNTNDPNDCRFNSPEEKEYRRFALRL